MANILRLERTDVQRECVRNQGKKSQDENAKDFDDSHP
jgi:hypothetical protein